MKKIWPINVVNEICIDKCVYSKLYGIKVGL